MNRNSNEVTIHSHCKGISAPIIHIDDFLDLPFRWIENEGGTISLQYLNPKTDEWNVIPVVPNFNK